MVNVPKFCTLKFLINWNMQIVQTDQKQSDQGQHCLPFSAKYFEKQLHKKQNLDKNVWNKVFEILGHLHIYHSFRKYWFLSKYYFFFS